LYVSFKNFYMFWRQGANPRVSNRKETIHKSEKYSTSWQDTNQHAPLGLDAFGLHRMDSDVCVHALHIK